MQLGRAQKIYVGCMIATILFCIVFMSYNQEYSFIPEQNVLLQFLGVNTSYLNKFQIPTRGENNIIFLETSCVVNQTADTSMELKLNYQQACAVESAAKTNPNASVYLFHTCPMNSSSLSQSSERVQRMFLQYPNVYVWHQNMDSFFGGTPLEELYRSGRMEKSDYQKSHASDVLRFLVLWKYGGKYLDLDFIVMRSLDTLDANYAGVECCDYMASGALAFSTEGIGKKMADLCVEELRTNFRGDIFAHNGPALITRVLRAQCGINSTDLMTKEACGGFAVLPSNTFYPIIYAWRLFYNESQSDATMTQVRKGHAVHLWNTLMGWEKGSLSLLRPGSRQPLVLLEQEFCPVVYSETALRYVAPTTINPPTEKIKNLSPSTITKV